MGVELDRMDAEKETIEQSLVMVQKEYKEAKLEAQVLNLFPLLRAYHFLFIHDFLI